MVGICEGCVCDLSHLRRLKDQQTPIYSIVCLFTLYVCVCGCVWCVWCVCGVCVCVCRHLCVVCVVHVSVCGVCVYVCVCSLSQWRLFWASLREPHTSVTALRTCVYVLARLLAAIYRKF